MSAQGLATTLIRIHDNRELLLELALREIREKYIRSVAGLAWLVIYPACLLSVYVVVFGFIFQLKAGHLGLDLSTGYPAFLIAGYIPWLGAAEVLSRSPQAPSSNSGLIRQFVFPLEILPLKVVLVSLAPQLVLLLLSLIYLLIDSGGRAVSLLWLTLPLLLVLEILLLGGLSWIISALGLQVGDTRQAVKLAVLIGPFAAPIFFPQDQLPVWLGRLLFLNPFTLLINCFRDALLAGRVEHPLSWLLIGPVCLALFWFGARVFNRLKPSFGDLL